MEIGKYGNVKISTFYVNQDPIVPEISHFHISQFPHFRRLCQNAQFFSSSSNLFDGNINLRFGMGCHQ